MAERLPASSADQHFQAKNTIATTIKPLLERDRLTLHIYGESKEPKSKQKTEKARQRVVAFEMAKEGLDTDTPKFLAPMEALLRDERDIVRERLRVLRRQMGREFPSDEGYLQASKTIIACRRKLEGQLSDAERAQIETELEAATVRLSGTEREILNHSYRADLDTFAQLSSVVEEAIPALNNPGGEVLFSFGEEDEEEYPFLDLDDEEK